MIYKEIIWKKLYEKNYSKKNTWNWKCRFHLTLYKTYTVFSRIHQKFTFQNKQVFWSMAEFTLKWQVGAAE